MDLPESMAIVAVTEITAELVARRKAHASTEVLALLITVAPYRVARVDMGGRAVVAMADARMAGKSDERGINAHASAQGLAIKGAQAVGALHDAAGVDGGGRANPSAGTHATSLPPEAASFIVQTGIT